jgi:hypothetical protein
LVFEDFGAELGATLQDLLYVLIGLSAGRLIDDIPKLIRNLPPESVNSNSTTQALLYQHVVDLDFWEKDRPRFLWWWYLDDPPGLRFPGLMIFALAAAGSVDEAESQMSELRKRNPVKGLQLAIGYMGLGRPGRAIASLKRAAKEGDILMSWLILTPLFESIERPSAISRGSGLRGEEVPNVTNRPQGIQVSSIFYIG